MFPKLDTEWRNGIIRATQQSLFTFFRRQNVYLERSLFAHAAGGPVVAVDEDVSAEDVAGIGLVANVSDNARFGDVDLGNVAFVDFAATNAVLDAVIVQLDRFAPVLNQLLGQVHVELVKTHVPEDFGHAHLNSAIDFFEPRSRR